jgi:SAM-dependent methyltransferase
MENLRSNQYNHLTAKERETLSFPAKLLLNKSLLVDDILDFGCGFGKDVELLKAKGKYCRIRQTLFSKVSYKKV